MVKRIKRYKKTRRLVLKGIGHKGSKRPFVPAHSSTWESRFETTTSTSTTTTTTTTTV